MKENTFYRLGSTLIVLIAIVFAMIGLVSERQMINERRQQIAEEEAAERQAAEQQAEEEKQAEQLAARKRAEERRREAQEPLTVHIVNPQLGKVILESGELKDGESVRPVDFVVTAEGSPVTVLLEAEGVTPREENLAAYQQCYFRDVRTSGMVTVTFTQLPAEEPEPPEATEAPETSPEPTESQYAKIDYRNEGTVIGDDGRRYRISSLEIDDVTWWRWGDEIPKGVHDFVVYGNGECDVRVYVWIENGSGYIFDLFVEDEYFELKNIDITGDVLFSVEYLP